MHRLLDAAWKVVLLLTFGSVLFCIAVDFLIRGLWHLLPWVLLLTFVAGAGAGLGALLRFRYRRQPTAGHREASPGMPLGQFRSRRPRGSGL